jgi:hypothetical protein
MDSLSFAYIRGTLTVLVKGARFEEVSAMHASYAVRVGVRAGWARTLAAGMILLSLCVAPPGPWATIATAAPNDNISITADHDTVKAGDEDTLKIRLRDVKDATLNGEPLKGDRIDRKVLVCATTTYTVQATDKAGLKVNKALTILATGTTSKPACLPDLAVTTLTVTQALGANGVEIDVTAHFVVTNRGGGPAGPFVTRLTNDRDPIVHDTPTATLDASETVSGDKTWHFVIAGVPAVITAVADPDHKVVQSNKLSHTKSVTVTVGAN